MIWNRSLFLTSVVWISLCLISCGRSAPEIKNKVPLTRVTGKVLVDGEPKEGVWVRYLARSATAEQRPEYKCGVVVTDRSGDFALKTYTEKDGVPAGEYGLNFSLLAKADSPAIKLRPELLPPECTDVKQPYQTFKVEQGNDLSLGEIQLKTNARVLKNKKK